MPTPDLRHALKKALQPPDGAAQGREAANSAPNGTPYPASGTGARRVAVLGVGSVLRSDDAAGVRVANALRRYRLPGVATVDGGSAPENCTAELRRISPSHLVIVDCAQMGEDAGAVRLIEAADIAGVSFGTHALPLSVLADYVAREIGCRVTVIGIQPASIEFGEGLSPEVSAAVQEVALALKECLQASGA
jgi:hydrogenase 3 maturation protease